MNPDDQFKITCRLIIKGIPENISDEHFESILNDNFSKFIKEQPLIIKLNKKYSTKKKNKICFFTVDSLEARAKIVDFFSSFELIDPKGMKQKLIVNDCLLQTRIKVNMDAMENTIDDCEHFIKFKEAMANEKIVDFKTKEEDYCKNLFEGIEDMITLIKAKEDDVTIATSASSSSGSTKLKGKMVIMKKTNDNTPIKTSDNIQYEIQNEGRKDDQSAQIQQTQPQQTQQPQPQDANANCEIEIIQESNSKLYKNNNRSQKNKGNYNDNYYRDDGYYYGNNNGGGNKKGFQKNNSNGYYDNGYYYDNGGNGGGSSKQSYRKGGYKKGYK